MALPQWILDALGQLTPVATNANRQAHLGYNTAVQGIGNTFGFPVPTPQDETVYPYLRGFGDGMPKVKRDIAGEELRGQVQPDLSTMGGAYLGQLPVSSVWSDQGAVEGRQWNGQPNSNVSTQEQFQSGYIKGSPYPFQAAYVARPKPPGQPEQGHWVHHAAGTNVDNENSAAWDEWVVDVPAQPGPDPSQTNIPLSGPESNAAKIAFYNALAKAAGGIDHQGFDQRLGTWMSQNPQILNDLAFLNHDFYTGMSNQHKLEVAHAALANKYGAALKNSPISIDYEGLLK